jgi:diguanylate cyclase (GGDEF)-like protein
MGSTQKGQIPAAQSVIDALPSLTLILDSDAIVVATNHAWQQFNQAHAHEVTSLNVADNYLERLRHDAIGARWANQALAGMVSVLSGRLASFEMEYDLMIERVDRTFSLTMVPLPEGGAVVSHVDITWRKSLERQLSHRATHDTLTGLPNRTLLTDRLMQALQRANRSGNKVGVLFCDLDQFKVLNDTLGHAAGDQVIIAVARRLEAISRASDSVTRFGGDEFVVVVEDVKNETEVLALADRLRTSVTAPMQIDGVDLWFGTSIGVVLTDGMPRATSRDVDNLLRDADTAMYQAKDTGRNRIVLFTPSMREAVASQLELTMSLRHAVSRGELRMQYQPIFRCSDGTITGAEALVRWQHPQWGLIGPIEFIEAAEDSGAISDIGKWVLNEACRQAAQWQSMTSPGFSVAVNLSAKQLSDPDLVTMVAETIDRHRIDPNMIALELTESALMNDPEKATAVLRKLSDLGVWISIDDFGTGYSSLAYLQRFPVDVLKIDRSFIARILDTPQTTALVHGIVDLAHALGLLTVAEGIEFEEQRRAVSRAGCDTYQGFLSARPLDVAEFTERLTEQGLRVPVTVS